MHAILRARLPAALLACQAILQVGCTPGPATVPVVGVVRHRGAPLADAVVMFKAPRPDAPKSTVLATATTDAAGRFALITQFGPRIVKRGAIAGRHRVVVSKQVPPSGLSDAAYAELIARETTAMDTRGFVTAAERAPPKVELLPGRYSDAAATTLEAVVASGSRNDFTFELE